MASSGYDSRVVTAFVGLGYELFPFSAFSESGNLILPSGLNLPAHYEQAIGRIAQVPAWAQLYRTVSVLDNPGWDSFMAGLAFAGNAVRVTVFRNMLLSPQQADSWSVAYNATVVKTLREYAGQSHIVDPKIVAAVNEAIPLVDDFYKSRQPPPAGNGSSLAGDDERAPAGDVSQMSIIPIALFGLKLLSAILTNVAKRTDVVTTIWWYPGSKQAPATEVDAARWIPLHREYAAGNERTVHGIWNPVVSPGQVRFWKGRDIAWRGTWVRDMPHEHWQWCQAFYPTLNCVPRTAVDTDGTDDCPVADAAPDPEILGVPKRESSK